MVTDAASFVVALFAQWVGASAVGARVLRLCARRSARGVRQRAGDACARRLDRGRSGRARCSTPAPVAGGIVIVDRRGRPRREPRRRVDAVARRAGINARGALLHVMGDLLGLGRGASSRAR